MARKIYSQIIALILILSACQSREGIIRVSTDNGKPVNPITYGWHYEEIGMIGEGGLYAEMVRNRGLEEANPPKGLEVKDGLYANVPDPESIE